jgi:hypothetical protein
MGQRRDRHRSDHESGKSRWDINRRPKSSASSRACARSQNRLEESEAANRNAACSAGLEAWFRMTCRTAVSRASEELGRPRICLNN